MRETKQQCSEKQVPSSQQAVHLMMTNKVETYSDNKEKTATGH